MLTIAMTNQKGGVGKTTCTMNLAAALQRLGYRVGVIDFDPQFHLSIATGVKIAHDAEVCLARALVKSEMHTPEIAEQLPLEWKPGIEVVPTNIQMAVAEREIYRERAPEHRLSRLIELWDAADRWDVCLIDSPPSLAILSDNALVAADQIIIPVEAEDSSLHALSLLMTQIESTRRELRVDPEVMGMIVNAYDSRRGYEVTSTYEQLQKMSLPILAMVKDKAAIRRAWRAGDSVFDVDPDGEEAAAFTDVAKSLIG